MVEFLRGAGMVFTDAAYEGAAKGRSLAMVRWLAAEAGVSTAGHVGRLLYWTVMGWDASDSRDMQDLVEAVRVVVGAAAAEHNDGQQGVDGEEEVWRDKNLLWTIAMEVVGQGNAVLAQYLVEQRLLPPLQKGFVQVAATAGCEALLEWMVEKLDRPVRYGGPYLAAAANGDLGTLNALRRLGVPWSKADRLAEAVRRGCTMPALRWLVEQGIPVGTGEAMEDAVAFADARGYFSAEEAGWLRELAPRGRPS